MVFLFQIPYSLASSTVTTCPGHIFADNNCIHLPNSPLPFYACSLSSSLSLLSPWQHHFVGIPISGTRSFCSIFKVMVQFATYQLYFFLCKGINDINTNQKKRKNNSLIILPPHESLVFIFMLPFPGLGRMHTSFLHTYNHGIDAISSACVT